GLCNVAIGFQRAIARSFGVGPERVAVDQVGLNHLTWIRAVHVDGRDVFDEVLADHIDAVAEQAELPAELIRELGAIPSYYLRYFYRRDEEVARLRRAKPRAQEVAEIERELLGMYRDPELAEKPALLGGRGGAVHTAGAHAPV